MYILSIAVERLDFFFFLETGIEPQGNMVLKPAVFTVETLEAGLGEVIVYVEDPEGHTEEVRYDRYISLTFCKCCINVKQTINDILTTIHLLILLKLRLKLSPTMIRKGHSLSPMCPRLRDPTRYA